MSAYVHRTLLLLLFYFHLILTSLVSIFCVSNFELFFFCPFGFLTSCSCSCIWFVLLASNLLVSCITTNGPFHFRKKKKKHYFLIGFACVSALFAVSSVWYKSIWIQISWNTIIKSANAAKTNNQIPNRRSYALLSTNIRPQTSSTPSNATICVRVIWFRFVRPNKTKRNNEQIQTPNKKNNETTRNKKRLIFFYISISSKLLMFFHSLSSVDLIAVSNIEISCALQFTKNLW